ncbi:UNVERIFIED_CONTAM: hypothetical protein GTU68_056386 [Idotea baltica]|nr:hypothetical protein [Idotea baltica]
MAAQTAVETVQTTSTTLTQAIITNKAQYQKDPAKFYALLNSTLGPVVDVEGMSRSVMTVRYYGRATPEQIKRFQDQFKQGLVQFYGNALLQYNNQEIRVLPNSNNSKNTKRTNVKMEVKSSDGVIYPVSYTMVLKNGSWKMRNVIINGINVGKLFREQFAQSMKKNNNNIDKVIDTWVDTIAKARSSFKGKA